jgi:hypothetical protein
MGTGETFVHPTGQKFEVTPKSVTPVSALPGLQTLFGGSWTQCHYYILSNQKIKKNIIPDYYSQQPCVGKQTNMLLFYNVFNSINNKIFYCAMVNKSNPVIFRFV